jgi:formamidopyrimidine-DNA glycosylase
LKNNFYDGNLFLIEPRRFASLKILKRLESNSGKDIIEKFDLKCFVKKYGSRKRKVKSLIMDQRALSGIGNIYACESLCRAGINPERIVAPLTEDDWKRVFLSCRRIIKGRN